MRNTLLALGVGLVLGAALVLTYEREVKAAPVEARWFIHPDHPIYVRNLECHEQPDAGVNGSAERLGPRRWTAGIKCTAVVENTSYAGIASYGVKWEQLGEGRKVVEERWSAADFTLARASERPNRELEGKGEIVFNRELEAAEGATLIHLHFIYVEMKDGTVIPASAAESMIYKQVIEGRAKLASEENE